MAPRHLSKFTSLPSEHAWRSFLLRGAGLLRRNEQGVTEGAWLGELAPGAAVRLEFQPTAGGRAHLPQWDESYATLSYETQARQVLERLDTNRNEQLDWLETNSELASEFYRVNRNNDQQWNHAELIDWCRRSRAGEVPLGQCVELASQGLRLSRGEVRLIAWSDEELPSMSVHPGAAQVARRTMFLVHLRRGQLPPPRPDLNRKADVAAEQPEAELEEVVPGPDSPQGKSSTR